MSTVRHEARALWRLSLPLVAGHAGNQVMSLVDTAMVGRLGAAQIGGTGVGAAIFFALTVFGIGCVMGMEAPVAQALGAGEDERARRVLGRGLRVATTVGVPIVAAVFAAFPVLTLAGVEPATAAEARRYLWGRAPGAVPFLMFVACRSYLQARGLTRPIWIAMLGANALHVVTNALFIYGDRALVRVGLPALGLPPLGVFGAGLSSTISVFASLGVLALAIRRAHAGVAAPRPGGGAGAGEDRALGRTILRLGLPIGLQIFAEVLVFATAGVLAGRLSGLAAAGHQIALNLASLTFTVTLGVASATSVRVGLHVGAGDTPAARRAGFLGLGTAASFMSLTSLLFLTAPRPLARLLTNDPAVLGAAVPLVMIAAAFQLFDGLQAVGAGALRGAGDTRAPLLANVAGHYAVGLPIAIYLGFGRRWGAVGLWWGLSAGLVAVSILLVVRFAWLSARPIARVR